MTKKKTPPSAEARTKKAAPKASKAPAKPPTKPATKAAPKAPASKAKAPAVKAAPAKPSKPQPKTAPKTPVKPAKPDKAGAKAPPFKPTAEDSKKKPATKADVKKAPEAAPGKPAKPTKAPKAAKPAAKSDRKKSAQAPPKPPPPNLADAKAAAERLAKLAGLPRVVRSDNGSATVEAKIDRLTKSPLPKKELDRFREILLAKRSEVTGDINTMENEALTSGGSGSLSSLPQHMADQGSDEYDQSLNLGLAETKRKTLREIDAALDRIDKNEFGVCEVLGVAIERERLDAEPWTRYSLDGARQRDRQLLR